jgi:hypothetical protein
MEQVMLLHRQSAELGGIVDEAASGEVGDPDVMRHNCPTSWRLLNTIFEHLRAVANSPDAFSSLVVSRIEEM